MNLGILHHLAAGLCLAGSLTACAQPPAGPALPDWLSQRIAVFERTPEDAEAVEILALPHAGDTAYLFVAPCCDQFNLLYDAQGRRLCAPSGGITGRGDGRCEPPPDLSSARPVWRQKASGARAPARP